MFISNGASVCYNIFEIQWVYILMEQQCFYMLM